MSPTVNGTRLKRYTLAESHRRQFAGEDYKAVANDLAEKHGFDWESDEYTELQTSPDPGCNCGFCWKAYWAD